MHSSEIAILAMLLDVHFNPVTPVLDKRSFELVQNLISFMLKSGNMNVVEK